MPQGALCIGRESNHLSEEKEWRLYHPPLMLYLQRRNESLSSDNGPHTNSRAVLSSGDEKRIWGG